MSKAKGLFSLGGNKRFLSVDSSNFHGCLRRWSLPSASSSRHFFSTSPTDSSSWVTTDYLEDDDRIATIRLGRKPANALSLEMCQEISKAIKTIEEDNKASAVIFSSSLSNKIFSAGLDIGTELYQPDADRLPVFWNAFQQVFLDLYGCTKMTTVANLEGPAPAGGCMLAASCDYRVMATTSNNCIGLNESHLGIVAPPWMVQQYVDVLGHRKAELALLSGTLFSPHEAFEIGLVDELVDDDYEVSQTYAMAQARAKEFVNVPPAARTAVKQLTRSPFVKQFHRDRDHDTEYFCKFVTQAPVQAAIGKYLEALAARSKKKKPK